MINIQNIDDNECFKWCSVRYLHPAVHHPTRIIRAGKVFVKNIGFKDINISVFSYGNKEKHPVYVSKRCCEDKHVHLSLIEEEEGKRHYVLIKDFNALIYDHILHRGRKQFCCYCLQAFSKGEILKHIKGCFKIKLVNKEL